jgi:hypothetical protein
MTFEDRLSPLDLSVAVVGSQPDPRCRQRTECQETLPQLHPSEWE